MNIVINFEPKLENSSSLLNKLIESIAAITFIREFVKGALLVHICAVALKYTTDVQIKDTEKD